MVPGWPVSSHFLLKITVPMMTSLLLQCNPRKKPGSFPDKRVAGTGCIMGCLGPVNRPLTPELLTRHLVAWADGMNSKTAKIIARKEDSVFMGLIL